MAFDLDAHLAAMSRAVHSGTEGGVPTKVVVAARTYATTPEHLWDAISEVSWLTLRVAPDGGGARLELEHVAPVDAGSTAAEFWTRYGPGAAGVGWDLGFQGLARHLADTEAAAPDPAAAAAWAASPEARALYASASRAWAEADIADGERSAGEVVDHLRSWLDARGEVGPRGQRCSARARPDGLRTDPLPHDASKRGASARQTLVPAKRP